MAMTAYPHLLGFNGAPFLNVSPMLTTGKVFYVDSNTGKANNPGDDPARPVATLAQAHTKATASKGDYIVCMPGHAETVSGVALSKAGVRVIGLGVGRNRPTFTSDGTAADVFNITAANCYMENIRIAGASANCTALVDLSSAATDFYAVRCEFAQAATPLSGLTISADRFNLIGCTWIGTANGPDRAISLEARCADWTIISPRFLFGGNGLDNELIKAVNVQTGYLIDDVLAVGLDTLVVNFASSSAAAPDGLFASGKVMYSAAVTSIEDGVAAATSLGMAFGDLKAVDVTGKAAAKIPLATAS